MLVGELPGGVRRLLATPLVSHLGLVEQQADDRAHRLVLEHAVPAAVLQEPEARDDADAEARPRGVTLVKRRTEGREARHEALDHPRLLPLHTEHERRRPADARLHELGRFIGHELDLVGERLVDALATPEARDLHLARLERAQVQGKVPRHLRSAHEGRECAFDAEVEAKA